MLSFVNIGCIEFAGEDETEVITRSDETEVITRS